MNIIKPHRRQFITSAFASLSAFLLPKLNLSINAKNNPNSLDKYTGEYDLILHGQNAMVFQLIQTENKLCLQSSDQNDKLFMPVDVDIFQEEKTQNQLIFKRLQNDKVDSVVLKLDYLEQNNGQYNCAIKIA